MDVTVVVATFGDDWWQELAASRAVPSAERLGVPVVRHHGEDLAGARNAGLAMVSTEWVCWLDADDELERGYFDHMGRGTADLRAPAVRYMHGHRATKPKVPNVAGHSHQCTGECLPYGNWLVIGAAARTSVVRAAGGFRDWGWSEDWDLWVRCWQAGATVEAIPQAVYRAHARRGSRNRAPSRDARLAEHRAIAEANGLPVP